jgi:anti-sigma factor RsiW
VKKHLVFEELHGLLCGTVTTERQMELLAHIAQCDVCAQALAAQTDLLAQTSPPAGFAERTLLRAHPVRPEKTAPPQESLRSYSLRVIAALAAALALLFSGVFQKLTQLDPREITQKFSESVRTFSITELSEQLFTKEAAHNAPKSQ